MPIGQQIDKEMWYIFHMENYSVIRNINTQKQFTTNMVSTEKTMHYMILLNTNSQKKKKKERQNYHHRASQWVKNPLANSWDAGDMGSVPGSGEKIAAHSIILAWKIPWTKEPSGLQSMGSQTVKHDWGTEHTHTHTHTCAQGARAGLGLLAALLWRESSTCRGSEPWGMMIMFIF